MERSKTVSDMCIIWTQDFFLSIDYFPQQYFFFLSTRILSCHDTNKIISDGAMNVMMKRAI
jgi:hypothetical protein